MDEFNLASLFAGDDENDARPNRKKKPIRGRTGVGMEKPASVMHPRQDGEGEVDVEKDEDAGRGFDGPIERPEGEEPDFDEITGREPEEEDEAFKSLLDRMTGGSASEGRAAKKRKLSKEKPLQPVLPKDI